MEFRLDPWQLSFLSTIGDKILCTGRQVGKSFIASKDCGDYARTHPSKLIMMIATTERQAYELFEKTLTYLLSVCPNLIKKGKDRPTKTCIKLSNGTKILCLPTGPTGVGIRGYTVDRLYVDEASRIPPEVWPAITPMLLTTAGAKILLSTPAGKDGYFYDCWRNDDASFDSFTRFSIDSKRVIEERAICSTWTIAQRDGALNLIKQEKSRMTDLQFAQEYMGEFIDELRQFFPTALILSCMTLKRSSYPAGRFSLPTSPLYSHRYLGVDVAGMGDDDTVLFSLGHHSGTNILHQFDMELYSKQRTTETVRRILDADTRHCYTRIYIDDGGMGVGVFDPLLEHDQTKRRVVAINNSSRSLDRNDRSKRLLKEDLYTHLLSLMEQGRIKLFDDADLLNSLRSIQAEYTGGKLKIFGRYTHITESLIRSAWGSREKGLNIGISF